MGALTGSVLGIGASAGLFALSLGFIRLDEALPMPLRIFIFVIAAILLLAVLASIRFRIKRRLAIANGRERNGRVTLRGKPDEEGGSAFLLFATAYDQWLLTCDGADVKAIAGDLDHGVKARATVGDDDRIYALHIEGRPVSLATAGVPFQGRMRELVEKAEKRFAEYEKRRAA